MKKIIYIMLLSGFVGIAGCATKPATFGDIVLADGESRIEIAEQWKQGKKDSIAGEKQVKNGEKLLKKGRADLQKGEQIIALWGAKVQANHQAYQETLQTAQGVNSGEIASEKADKLTKIAKAWEGGDNKIAEGNTLIERGKKSIAEGEADILNGQELTARGLDEMKKAESHYKTKTQ